MLIQLNDSDLAQMPPTLCTALLNWLRTRQSKSIRQLENRSANQPQVEPQQLAFDFDNRMQAQQKKKSSQASVRLVQPSGANPNQRTDSEQVNNSHVQLSQLFDAGMIGEGTPIRVKLKKKREKELGYSYVTTGLRISSKGVVIYNGEEFDKPSPLAAKVNGSSANGWEYVEVKKNDRWICLDELRKIWRSIL